MNAESLIVNAAFAGLLLPMLSIPLMLLAALIQSKQPILSILVFGVAAILIGVAVFLIGVIFFGTSDLIGPRSLAGLLLMFALLYLPALGIFTNGVLTWLIWKSAWPRIVRITLAGAHLIAAMLIGAFCINFNTIRTFTGPPWH